MPNVVYDNSAGSQKTIGIETILLKQSEGRDLQQIVTSSHAFALLSVIICIKIHTKCFYTAKQHICAFWNLVIEIDLFNRNAKLSAKTFVGIELRASYFKIECSIDSATELGELSLPKRIPSFMYWHTHH